jgi:predicted ArsR family transcriptional regulator
MDRLEAVGDPELRATLLLARGRARPVTADEVAVAQGVHRNVARARLERLVEAGLLAAGYERRSGRSGPGAGRPAKTYAVVPDLEGIEFPGRRYATLVGLLVDALPRRGRAQRLRAVGADFGGELAAAARLRPARDRAAGFERLCEALRRLGFQASLEEVGPEGALISCPTCPLRPLVRAQPEAVAVDRGRWSALAAHALAGVELEGVECETRDCLDDRAACLVRILA